MISIKAQKILRFIPLLNMLTMVFWCVTAAQEPLKMKEILRMMLVTVCSVAVIMGIRLTLMFSLKNETLNIIAAPISVYLVTLSIAFASVRRQEQLS